MDVRQAVKEWKAAGLWGVPKILLEAMGNMEAAAFVYEVVQGVIHTTNPEGLFYISDADLAARLYMGYERFRNIRRKVEEAGIVGHEVRRASGKTLPHYSVNLLLLLSTLEEVKAGGAPLFGATRARPLCENQQSGIVDSNKAESPLCGFQQTEQNADCWNPQSRFVDSNKVECVKTQSGASKGDSENPLCGFQQTITTPIRIPPEGEDPAQIWARIMGTNPSPELSELIKRRVVSSPDSLAAWEETLIGWRENPRWNNSNIDGQISRYAKKLGEGDFHKAEVKAPPKTEEENKDREQIRSQIYGD